MSGAAHTEASTLPDAPAAHPGHIHIDRTNRPRDEVVETVEARLRDGYAVKRVTSTGAILVPRRTGVLHLVGRDRPAAGAAWRRRVVAGRARRFVVLLDGDGAAEDDGSPDADELWTLSPFCPIERVPQFVIEYTAARHLDVVEIANSRLATDLLPAIRLAFPRLRTVVCLGADDEGGADRVTYVGSRYGNLVDAFVVEDHAMAERLGREYVAPEKVRVIPGAEGGSPADPDAFERLYFQLVAEHAVPS